MTTVDIYLINMDLYDIICELQYADSAVLGQEHGRTELLRTWEETDNASIHSGHWRHGTSKMGYEESILEWRGGQARARRRRIYSRDK